jgi:hypothetical protein
VEVQEAVLDVRERSVRLCGTQAIAGTLELGARFLRQAARAFGRALGVVDPAQEQQALATTERLIERGKVPFTLLDRDARVLVTTQ